MRRERNVIDIAAAEKMVKELNEMEQEEQEEEQERTKRRRRRRRRVMEREGYYVEDM